MLPKLLGFLASPHPDDPVVRLHSVRFEKLDVVLDLTVMDYELVERWASSTIRARGLRDCSIGLSGGELCLLGADHALIRQYTDPKLTLYFRGVPESVASVVGRLWKAHQDVASNWIPLERFFNSCLNLEDLLQAKHALVADGPKFLIDAYAEVLSSALLNPYTVAWRCAQSPSLEALELGDSFFVASSFDEEAFEEFLGHGDPGHP